MENPSSTSARKVTEEKKAEGAPLGKPSSVKSQPLRGEGIAQRGLQCGIRVSSILANGP